MRRRTDKFVALCAGLCVLCTIVVVVVVAPTVLDASSRSDDAAGAAASAKSAAASAQRVADAIQRQRKEAIRTNCRAQNRRNVATIRALDVLIARLPPGPRRARAKTNRKGTVFLLNAIVPYQDCKKLVRRSAPTPHP